nr:hypothetical protein [Nitrospirota bacterium]
MGNSPSLQKRLLCDATIFVTSVVLMIAQLGCAEHRHYHAYLLEQQPEGQYGMKTTNAIRVPKDKHLRIVLDTLRVGFSKDERIKDPHTDHTSLGGRDYWLVTEMFSLDFRDPLGLKEKRFVTVSNVKTDQESLGFLALDDGERVLFDAITDTSYRVRMSLYRIHGFELKKQILKTAQGFLPALYDQLKLLATAAGNFLAKPAVDLIIGQTETPYFYEKALLEAGAALEFSGTFDLIRVESGGNSPAIPGQTQWALYDVIKSELDRDGDGAIDGDVTSNVTSLYADNRIKGDSLKKASLFIRNEDNTVDSSLLGAPQDIQGYVEAYLFFHRHTPVRLASKEIAEIELPDPKGTADAAVRNDLTKAYILFSVNTGDDAASPPRASGQ